MKLRLYQNDYAIARLASIPPDIHKQLEGSIYSLTVTTEEISLMCESDLMPASKIKIDKGWRLLRMEGIYDLNMIGIIAATAKVLAEHSVSIFVVSSYNTDSILVREAHCDIACAKLEDAGYIIVKPTVPLL